MSTSTLKGMALRRNTLVAIFGDKNLGFFPELMNFFDYKAQLDPT